MNGSLQPLIGEVTINQIATMVRTGSALKKIISTFLTVVLLFVVFARPPGIMLSNDADGLTFEICTAYGIQLITLPSEDGEPVEPVDTACAFFAAQSAAVLDAVPSLQEKKLNWQFWAHFPQHEIAIKRRAQNSNLTRGPPLSS